MRQLKFRVWFPAANRFLEPEKIAITGDGILLNFGYQTDPSPGDHEYWAVDCWNSQNSFIVQQFTGIKDFKDKEIFDGDILFCPDRVVNKYVLVIWESDRILIKDQDILREFNEFLNYNIVEVKGNIYENPELLEQEKN